MKAVGRWLRDHQYWAGFSILVALNFAGWRSLEAERHDRCVEFATKFQRSLLGVADEFTNITPPERERLEDYLTDELAIDDC